jgi:hypothetical protein
MRSFIHNLYFSSDIIRMIKSWSMRLTGLLLSKGEMRNQSLVEKPEGKRPLGRPRHRWEDIKLDMKM